MRLAKAWAMEFGCSTKMARRYMRNVRYWLAPQNYDYTKTKYQLYGVSWYYTPHDHYERRNCYFTVGQSRNVMARSKKDAINILKKDIQKRSSEFGYPLPILRNSDFEVSLLDFVY